MPHPPTPDAARSQEPSSLGNNLQKPRERGLLGVYFCGGHAINGSRVDFADPVRLDNVGAKKAPTW
jgi:hypothetical protein